MLSACTRVGGCTQGALMASLLAFSSSRVVPKPQPPPTPPASSPAITSARCARPTSVSCSRVPPRGATPSWHRRRRPRVREGDQGGEGGEGGCGGSSTDALMNGEAQDLAPPGGGARGLEGRAEVYTSAPFKSVREVVYHFGSSAVWSTHLIKRIFAPPKKQEGLEELANLEEQIAQLEKELSIKERETHDALKELEPTKKVITDLRLKIQNEEAEPNAGNGLDLDKYSWTQQLPQVDITVPVPQGTSRAMGVEGKHF